mgnify:CR=1 FL=1
MRVIAGSARSLKLKTLEGIETRPTTDRIKETLFNMISPQMYDCIFLDLFAGSGGIGIEALSRGAREAVFVEKNPKAMECVKENLKFTRLEKKGHTHLVIVKDYGEFEILGRTRDDAAGEAFDKVARAIGLGYPGGPKVDKLSKEGNPDAIGFPKAKIGDCPYDFSFSGVKSAVLNYINHAQMTGEEVNRADLAASFQKAVVDVLVEHTMLAAKDYGMNKIAIAGGVASNGTLRAAMEEACKKNNYSFYRPSPIFCTDNAAMIGVAGKIFC